MRQFADRGCLTAAIDTDHQNDQRRFRAELLRLSLIHNLCHDALQCQRDIFTARNMLFFNCFSELLHNLQRGVHPDIGGNQDFLQLIHHVLIDLSAQHNRVSNSLGKPAEKGFFFF